MFKEYTHEILLNEVLKLPYYPIKYEGKHIKNEDHYFTIHNRRYLYTYKFLCEYLNSNDLLLDVGGEPGHITSIIKNEITPNVSIVGQWQSETITLRFSELKIEAVECDIDTESLPYKDNSFDVITLFEVVEHMTNVPHLFEEIRRVLRPGGYFILSTPNITKLKNRINLMLGHGIGWPSIDKAESGCGYFDVPFYMRHYREYTANELTHLLGDALFKNVTIKYKNSYGKRVSTFTSNIIPSLSDTIFIIAKK
ncbi:MAG: hypothetical protein DHS20C13_27830 [Thermodesulfobacteriota bacterium]|nr:MAG: hypothetical protein DHS20C13_27830 [Thermodesulfobacteriota bacterium]